MRHLHQSGAVAEPARTSSNYREYTISDLAAVVRARALIDAGVPIADVAAKDTALVVCLLYTSDAADEVRRV